MKTADSCSTADEKTRSSRIGGKKASQQMIWVRMAVMVLVIITTYVSEAGAQVTRWSVATGNWSSTSTWSHEQDGTAGASVPAAGDDVFIDVGEVTLDQPTANLNLLQITARGTFIAQGINSVTAGTISVFGIYDNRSTGTITGTMTVQGGGYTGKYIHANTNTSLPQATWATGSTCEVTGIVSGTLGSGFDGPFYNFTWNCQNQTAQVSMNNKVLNVTNRFTLISTGTGSLTPNGSPTYLNYLQTGGTYILSTATTSRSLSVGNNFEMNGGIFNLSSGSRLGTLSISGNLSILEGSTLTYPGSAWSTIEFVGTTKQTFTSGGQVIGAIDFNVNTGSILWMASEDTYIGGTGTFTLYEGATLGVTSANGIQTDGFDAGNVRTSGSRTYSEYANYVYCGTNNQLTGTGLPPDLSGKLTINNTGASGNNTVTLDNTCLIVNGLSFDIVSGIFEAGTNLTMSSTSGINRSGGSMAGTIQGPGVYNVNYTGNSMTASSELSGGGLNNITVTLGEGQSLTLDQVRTPDGNVTVNSGILDLGAFTIDRSAAGGTLTVANGATIKIGGTGSMPGNYTTHSLGSTSTVEYNGAEQSISPDIYGNLTTSGTGMKTIEAGSDVTVTTALVTNDLLTINSTSLSDNGSLIVFGTSDGDVTFNRTLNTGTAGDRHFFSSPVTTNSEANTGTVTQVWGYDEVTNGWPTTGMTDLVSGRGYNLEQEDSSPGEGLITFTGPVAQSASFTATSPYRNGYLPRATEFDYGLDNPDLTIWASGRGWESSLYGGGGWNLLGNPFTSAMNARTFVTVNAGVFDPNYQAVYLYDGTANTYYYIANSTGWPSGDFMDRAHIQAGQGFWALAYYNNVDFSFTPGMQEHSNQVPMLKSAATDDRWPGIRLEVRSGGEEASTTLVFNEAMALGLDRGYDVGMLSAGSEIEIYTTLVEKDNGVNFARQALPTANADAIIVPIGIDTEKGGEVTFSAYTVPLGNNKFWLEDRTTGIITDLSASTYKVLLPAKTYGTGRFYLKATSSITDIETQAEEPGSGLRIWAYDGKVIIKGEVTGRAVCSVYDIRGKKITETHLDGGDMNTITIPAGSTGIYIIRVADGPRITTQKVVFP